MFRQDLENELARRTHLYQRLLKKMDQKPSCLFFATKLGCTEGVLKDRDSGREWSFDSFETCPTTQLPSAGLESHRVCKNQGPLT